MNKFYLIVIDKNLMSSDSNLYQRMVGTIKEFGAWARITPDVWVVSLSDNSTGNIRNTLSELVSSERIFVVEITKSQWSSYNLPQEVVTWLQGK